MTKILLHKSKKGADYVGHFKYKERAGLSGIGSGKYETLTNKSRIKPSKHHTFLIRPLKHIALDKMRYEESMKKKK